MAGAEQGSAGQRRAEQRTCRPSSGTATRERDGQWRGQAAAVARGSQASSEGEGIEGCEWYEGASDAGCTVAPWPSSQGARERR